MKRKHKVIKVTNADMMKDLELVRATIHTDLGCKRKPGSMIAIDLLLQFWFNFSLERQNDFLKEWKTRVVGYPNSERLNPGSFAGSPLEEDFHG